MARGYRVKGKNRKGGNYKGTKKSDNVVSQMSKLPASMRQRIGSHMVLPKGRRDLDPETRVTVYSWDAAVDCIREECPAHQYCHLVPDKKSGTQKCAVQVQYVRQCANAILNSYPKADEILLYKIGTHLIPLYGNLIRLKITELGVRRLSSFTNSGSVKIHPVYKELRETHRSILNTWKELGLGPPISDKEVVEEAGDMKKGDPSLYSRMMESSQGGKR